LAQRRHVVDRDDDVARANAGLDRRIALDGIDDDGSGLLILRDVHPDAAEIAALELLFEAVDLGLRQVDRVRIAQGAEHSGDRGLRVLVARRRLGIARFG